MSELNKLQFNELGGNVTGEQRAVVEKMNESYALTV